VTFKSKTLGNVYCFYSALNTEYTLATNGDKDLRDVFILVLALEIHLAFSFSLGPNHIKWATHKLLKSLPLYGDFKKKRKANCLFILHFMPVIPTGRVNIYIFSFLSLSTLGYLSVLLF
jgi:hypothetical protein